MKAYQGALMVIAEVRRDACDELRKLLLQIGSDAEKNTTLRFADLTTVHFARFVILDEVDDVHGSRIAPSLALATNYDGPVAAHLEELVRVCGPGLDQIYSHCVGYPVEGKRTQEEILSYLRDHIVNTTAFFAMPHGWPLQQIRCEGELREAIEKFLDERDAQESWERQEPAEVRRAIQSFVENEPSLEWARKDAVPPATLQAITNRVVLLGYGLAGLALLLGLPALLARLVQFAFGLSAAWGFGLFAAFASAVPLSWVVLLRINEIRDVQADDAGDREHTRQLGRREDHLGQNQMTRVDHLKPGWFRLSTSKLALFVANLLVPRIFTNGHLAGISTIHFARWVLIDEGRRMLFFSNYDGSWENYVGDFIDKASWGLTAIWSNTVGFPKTRFLFFAGAKDEQRFKATTRDAGVPTELWYSAYKHLSAENINNNAKIRADLWRELDVSATRQWLRRL